jgi:outer membrane protein assembly factor BamD
MNRWIARILLLAACLMMWPLTCPAPIIYRPGEGWSYEPVGGGSWRKTRAKDQLEAAQAAFDKKNYSLALRSAKYVVSRWPFSDYAPKAQYLVAQCYSLRRYDERAFKEFQKLIEKYPKVENYQEVLHRQFEIASRFLSGQWFRIFWGFLPTGPSMDKASQMFEKIIKNGPFSDIAPQAQMNIGAAAEKKWGKDYPKAIKAYEKAADRYHDQPKVASDAHYKAGIAYTKQARTAEYDQSVAGKAIAAFSDFSTLYPEDPRVPETQKIIYSLKTEQSRGSFEIAQYYEKKKRWDGAKIYYNDAIFKDPGSKYAKEAKLRIEAIQKKLARQTFKPAAK